MMIERSVSQTVSTHPLVSEVVAPDEFAALYEPQSVVGIFDRAFDLYKSHAFAYIIAVAVILIPAHILLQLANNFWLTPLSQSVQGSSDSDTFVQSIQLIGAYLFVGVPDAGVPGVLAAIAFFIASVPVTLMTSSLLLGRAIPPRLAFRRSLRLVWRQSVTWGVAFLAFLGGYALWFTGFLIALGIVVSGAAQVQDANTVIVGVLVTLLFVVPYFLACNAIARAFIFATPLIILEDASPTLALPRNAQLIPKPLFKKAWLATAGLPITLLGLQILLSYALSALMFAFSLQPLLAFWAQTAFTALLSVFFQPYAMIFFTLLYYDMAFRRDGLDIRLLAEAAHLPAPALPNPASPSLSTPLAPPMRSRGRKR